MRKFTSISVRREVAAALRHLAQIEKRPAATIVEIMLTERASKHSPAARSAILAGVHADA